MSNEERFRGWIWEAKYGGIRLALSIGMVIEELVKL